MNSSENIKEILSHLNKDELCDISTYILELVENYEIKQNPLYQNKQYSEEFIREYNNMVFYMQYSKCRDVYSVMLLLSDDEMNEFTVLVEAKYPDFSCEKIKDYSRGKQMYILHMKPK